MSNDEGDCYEDGQYERGLLNCIAAIGVVSACAKWCDVMAAVR